MFNIRSTGLTRSPLPLSRQNVRADWWTARAMLRIRAAPRELSASPDRKPSFNFFATNTYAIAIDWRPRRDVSTTAINPNDGVHKLILSVTTPRVFLFFSSLSLSLFPSFLFFFSFNRVWSLAAGFARDSFSFDFVLTALVFVLTLIFTVNTCIVLFLQLQSHARSARRLKFLLVPRLSLSFSLSSAVSRGRLSWISFFFFFYISFYRVFFVGTRGYVRQRRVITLNNAARRVATGHFVPTDADLRCNRKSGKRAGDAFRSIASRVRWVPLPYGVEWEGKKKKHENYWRLRNRIGVRSPFSFISLSFRYSVVKVLQIYKRALIRRNVTACLSLSTWHHTHAHTLSFSPSLLSYSLLFP